ncbi:sugar phosphate isomerase/epimerase family protein [Puia dinghuensis]|uniref:Sugar phosphate isomerase n=1 Tax=Puia dinghuensis TaxID=1792502 RepID=A0A8J2XSQ9_9BACT|nr:TIM barrel protein [Puia dinghuensis]GGB11335.1 sugar phosphate isomerase [Puia dinghuensis]
MHTRRSFLKTSALYSAGILAAPALPSFLTAAGPVIGLQLYTVRDQMAADPNGTLAKVAQIGYNSLEGATYNNGIEKFYGMDPNTFAGVLKNNGLIMRSCHYRLGEDSQGATLTNGEYNGTILHDWDKAVEDAHTLGLHYMVCAWLSPKERLGLDHYKKMANDFNVAGEKCQKAGIQFCYHNHDFEFDAQGGKYPYDVLLEDTDPKLVKMEMDLYWVSKAGHDPVQLFDAHPGRFPLWHLKDMDATPQHSFTEVGNGTIDFKKIFANKAKSGMKYFFVEQDRCPGSPFDSITKSIAYIKQNLV